MAKKKTPFLDFYNTTNKLGRMIDRDGTRGSGGLCNTSIGNEKIFYLFFPDEYEKVSFKIPHCFWGANHRKFIGNEYSCMYEFTTLRQTVVLFCAAINDEL